MSIHPPDTPPDRDDSSRRLTWLEKGRIELELNGLVASGDSFEQRKADLHQTIIEMIGAENRSLLPDDPIEAAQALLMKA